MFFSRTPTTTLRFASVFAVLLSLLLAPVHATSVAAPCSAPDEVTMECDGCCEAMSCCVQTPAQPAPPAVPASGQHASFDFSIALMASTRPLLGLLPTGQRDFFSTASAPVGRSRALLALLCVRLI